MFGKGREVGMLMLLLDPPSPIIGCKIYRGDSGVGDLEFMGLFFEFRWLVSVLVLLERAMLRN